MERLCPWTGVFFLQMMSKPSEQVSAVSSSPSGAARQHQSHPEETEEELREHQGLASSSPPPSSSLSVKEAGPMRTVVIKQEPVDPQELEEKEQRERQAEKDFLFRQVRRCEPGGLESGGNGVIIRLLWVQDHRCCRCCFPAMRLLLYALMKMVTFKAPPNEMLISLRLLCSSCCLCSQRSFAGRKILTFKVMNVMKGRRKTKLSKSSDRWSR